MIDRWSHIFDALDRYERSYVILNLTVHRILAQHDSHIYCDECPWPRMPPPIRKRIKKPLTI